MVFYEFLCCFCVVLCVGFCTGHFVMVPLNLTFKLFTTFFLWTSRQVILKTHLHPKHVVYVNKIIRMLHEYILHIIFGIREQLRFFHTQNVITGIVRHNVISYDFLLHDYVKDLDITLCLNHRRFTWTKSTCEGWFQFDSNINASGL